MVFYKGIGNFLLISMIDDGFYDLNWNKEQLKYVHIDSVNKVNVLTDLVNLYITIDELGKLLGCYKRKYRYLEL